MAIGTSLLLGGLGAAASIGGGLLSAGGAGGAGAASAAAGGQALANAQDAANRDVARLSPWQASGAAAAQQVNALLGLGSLGPIGDKYNTYGTTPGNWQQDQKDAFAKFQTDPGYEFRQQQGINALSRSAAARGSTLSGAQAKGLNDYGQGMASAEYGNYFNRLTGVSTLGENAASGQNTAYNNALNPGIAQNFQGAMGAAGAGQNSSNALASGFVGAAKSIASAYA